MTDDKFLDLKSQIVISSWGGSRRAKPYAFTEQGVALLSSVLRSKRAVRVNIEIRTSPKPTQRRNERIADIFHRGHFVERWDGESGAFCSGLFQMIAIQRYGLNIRQMESLTKTYVKPHYWDSIDYMRFRF